MDDDASLISLPIQYQFAPQRTSDLLHLVDLALVSLLLRWYPATSSRRQHNSTATDVVLEDRFASDTFKIISSPSSVDDEGLMRVELGDIAPGEEASFPVHLMTKVKPATYTHPPARVTYSYLDRLSGDDEERSGYSTTLILPILSSWDHTRAKLAAYEGVAGIISTFLALIVVPFLTLRPFIMKFVTSLSSSSTDGDNDEGKEKKRKSKKSKASKE